MKKLLRYMDGYKVQCILGPIFKALEAIFELCIPLVVKNIIDIGIANSDKPYILKMVGLLVVLAVRGHVVCLSDRGSRLTCVKPGLQEERRGDHVYLAAHRLLGESLLAQNALGLR